MKSGNLGMKHIIIDREDERVKKFLRSIQVDREGSNLELEGQPLLRVLPPYALTGEEKEALIDRGRELVRRSRQHNVGVPAKVIQREVRQAVDEVRRRKRQ